MIKFFRFNYKLEIIIYFSEPKCDACISCYPAGCPELYSIKKFGLFGPGKAGKIRIYRPIDVYTTNTSNSIALIIRESDSTEQGSSAEAIWATACPLQVKQRGPCFLLGNSIPQSNGRRYKHDYCMLHNIQYIPIHAIIGYIGYSYYH